jgi:hypothetical protein
MKQFLFFFLMIPLILNAQSSINKITMGQPMNDGPLTQYFYSDGVIISVYASQTQTLISKYDSENLTKVSTKVYNDLPENKTYLTFNWIQLNERLFLLYSWYHKKEKYCALYAKEVDFGTGEFIDSGKEIFRLDGGMFDYDRMRLKVLSDGSGFVAVSRIESNEKSSKNFSTIDARIFDSNMAIIGGSQSKLDQTDAAIGFTKRYSYSALISLDSKAYPYALLNVKDQNSKGNNFTELVRLPKDNLSKQVISNYTPETPFFRSFWLEESPIGGMLYGGILLEDELLYEEEDILVPDVSGFFITHVNDDGSYRYKNSIKFPLQTANQNVSPKELEKNKKNISKNGKLILPYQKYREFNALKDGSYLFISEEFKKKTATQNNGVRVYDILLGDIYVSKIDKDGNLLWMNKISKSQIGYEGNEWAGYKYIDGGDKQFFIFQDRIENASLQKNEDVIEYKGDKEKAMILVTIDDATGEMNRELLFPFSDVNGKKIIDITIASIVEVSNKNILLLATIDNAGTVFIKIELN